MPERKVFGLRLNRSPNLYYPGDTVSGEVVINYPKDKLVSSISMLVVGSAKAGCRGNRRPTERSYIEKEITLIEGAVDEIKIPSGPQEFPFSFELPTDLPSTLDSPHGKVGYYMEIIVRQKSLLGYSKTKSPIFCFNVHAILDLNVTNAGPSWKNPVSITNKRRMGSGGNVVYCTFNANKGGFVPGELLLCNLEINNENCTKRIQTTTVHLVQRTTAVIKTATYLVSDAGYYKDKEANAMEVVMSQAGPSVAASERLCWVLNNVRVPNVPPTQTNRDHLVLIQYEIQIEMKFSTDSVAALNFPIVIGTIPIRSRELENHEFPNVRQDDPSKFIYQDLPPHYDEVIASPNYFSYTQAY